MSGVTMEQMSEVASELRAAIADHDDICARLGQAEAEHKRAYLKAHAASTTFHPERRVKEHEVAAEEAAFDSWAALNALQYSLKAAKERAHSLRQILSSFQSQVRVEAEFTRGAA